MRKTFGILVLCFFTLNCIYGQFKPDPCVGNTQRNTMAFEKSLIFNVSGINLNKYDWSDPTINCHINSTIKQFGASRGSKVGGVLLCVVGTTLLLGAVPFLASSYTRDIGAPFLAFGLIGVGTSVPLFISGKKQKKKSNYHLNQVSEYYRVNKLL